MTTPPTSRIRAVSKFFFEGDRKFFIKGATYGPFKPDEKGNTFGKPETVDVDLGSCPPKFENGPSQSGRY